MAMKHHKIVYLVGSDYTMKGNAYTIHADSIIPIYKVLGKRMVSLILS